MSLRRNDQQLRSIVESVRDYAIYLLDADGYVMTWNPAAERIKGYTADEILGKHFSRFFTRRTSIADRPAELLRLAAARGRLRKRAGACARTARASGPTASLPRFATPPAQ
jgi:PAS domain S-box-containing protein